MKLVRTRVKYTIGRVKHLMFTKALSDALVYSISRKHTHQHTANCTAGMKKELLHTMVITHYKV